MARFIYGARNEIHIFDLRQTVQAIDAAHAYLSSLISRGGRIIFVGTKRQARDATRQISNETGQYYVIERWLGGTLTNFNTVKTSPPATARVAHPGRRRSIRRTAQNASGVARRLPWSDWNARWAVLPIWPNFHMLWW